MGKESLQSFLLAICNIESDENPLETCINCKIESLNKYNSKHKNNKNKIRFENKVISRKTPLMHNWFSNTNTIIDPSIQLIISLSLKQ